MEPDTRNTLIYSLFWELVSLNESLCGFLLSVILRHLLFGGFCEREKKEDKFKERNAINFVEMFLWENKIPLFRVSNRKKDILQNSLNVFLNNCKNYNNLKVQFLPNQLNFPTFICLTILKIFLVIF